jgi:hypothetical protein
MEQEAVSGRLWQFGPKEGKTMCDTARLRSRVSFWSIAAVMLCLLVSPPGTRAQSDETDTGEVSAFGGGTFGLGGAQPAVGASTGLAFSRYGIGLFEVAYSPLKDNTLRRRIGAPAESSSLFDFNASFHIRIPVRERWAPYAILGGGLLLNPYRTVLLPSGPTDPSTGEPTRPGGATFAVDDFNFGFHTGGGVRYYIRPDWGIRPELKIIVSNRTYARFTVGIFYNMPSGWPW